MIRSVEDAFRITKLAGSYSSRAARSEIAVVVPNSSKGVVGRIFFDEMAGTTATRMAEFGGSESET
jgi:hypothetical protein